MKARFEEAFLVEEAAKILLKSILKHPVSNAENFVNAECHQFEVLR